MSTCVEVAEFVSRESGRPELVTDFRGGDFTPTTTCLNLIDKAHKYLDRRFSHENREISARFPIGAGDYVLTLPAGLKFITRVDIETSDGSIIPCGGLERRTLAQLRDRYGEVFGAIPRALPREWCRNAIAPIVNILTNGSFDSSVAPWRIVGDNGELVYEDGTAKLVSTQSGVLAGGQMFYTFPSTRDLRGFIFDFEIKEITTGTSLIIGLQTNGILEYAVLAATATVGFSSIVLVDNFNEDILAACEGVFIGTLSAAGKFIRFDNFKLYHTVDLGVVLGNEATFARGDFIFMPPSDSAYTLVIYYAAHAANMTENDDISWWSDKHPDVLELAIKRQIAIDLNRNKTEEKDYEDDIETAILDLETDAVLEAQQGGPETRHIAWRGESTRRRPRWRLGGD